MGLLYSKSVFLPPSPSYSELDDDLIFIQKESTSSFYKDQYVPAYYIKVKDPRATVIYSHGNAEDIGQSKDLVTNLAKHLQIDVLLYEYTGYGVNYGRSSENNCYRDLETVLEYLVDIEGVKPQNIILYGRSLGSGPTVHMAYLMSQNNIPLRGVILQSPIASVVRVVSESLAKIPGVDMFENIKKIGFIHFPILIVHGDSDQVVPFSHGLVRFFEKAKPKTLTQNARNSLFVNIKGGDHNNLESDFWNLLVSSISNFITKTNK